MIASARSLAVAQAPRRPLMMSWMLSGTRSHSSPVAQMAAISLRPTPAPNAPSQPKCGVCESAPSTVCPGETSASSLSTW